jgi:hypothetical protein
MIDNVGINRNPFQRKMVIPGDGTVLHSALLPAGVRSVYGITREQQYREIYMKGITNITRGQIRPAYNKKAGKLTELLTRCMELPSKTPY